MPSSPSSEGAHRGSGQATVEAALALPFVLLLVLLIVQVGFIVRAQVLVTHAAREAARAAAVDASAAASAARAASTLDPARMQIEVAGRGAPGTKVTVTVRYEVATDVPLVGLFVPDVHLAAQATMRVETALEGANAVGGEQGG